MDRMKFPIVNGAAAILGDSASVFGARSTLTVSAPNALLVRLFELCNGRITTSDVESQLAIDWDVTQVADLVEAMFRVGFLVDSSAVLESAWKFAENPSRLSFMPAEGVAMRLPREAALRTRSRIAGTHYVPKESFALRDILERRESAMAFGGGEISWKDFISVLWSAYGVIRSSRDVDGQRLPGRTTPSAGGSYPLRIHVAVMNNGAQAAVYEVRYLDDGSVFLRKIRRISSEIYRCIVNPAWLFRAFAWIVISGDLSQSARKYGNRGVLYTALEAGHAAQNVLLSCVDFSIAAREIGGFFEDRLTSLLKLPDRHTPMTSVIVGTPPKLGASPLPAIDFRWVEERSGSYSMPFNLALAKAHGLVKTEEWCWGRSTDPLIAYIKATAEAQERMACELPSGTFFARMADLPAAIDPRLIVAYTRRQYESTGFPFRPFDDDALYEWKLGHSIATQREVAVLADCTYFPSTKTRKYGYYTAPSTSGVAAHTDLDLAIRSAVLEVIERDAFMYFWLAKERTPNIVQHSLPSNLFSRISMLECTGVRIALKVLTREFSPVVCIVGQHVEKAFTICLAASGFNYEDAIEHALMEVESVVFMRLLQSERRPIQPNEVRSVADHYALYCQPAYFRQADWMFDGGKVELRALTRRLLVRRWGALMDQLRIRDLNPCIFDLTPPHACVGPDRTPLHVVRAVIPGLIPMSFGWNVEPLALPRANEALSRCHDARTVIAFPHPFT
jgi:ribosomal protein S12 methylthiotransferase accessory factor